MSRMVNDITALRLLVGMGVLMMTNTPVYFIYALIFMTYLNRRLTVAAIIPAILLLFAVRKLTRALMERSLKVQQELGNIGAKVQESLAGIHVVKAYTLEEHEAGRFRALNDRYNEQGLALARTRGGLFPMIRAVASGVHHDRSHLRRCAGARGADVHRRSDGVHAVRHAARVSGDLARMDALDISTWQGRDETHRRDFRRRGTTDRQRSARSVWRSKAPSNGRTSRSAIFHRTATARPPSILTRCAI